MNRRRSRPDRSRRQPPAHHRQPTRGEGELRLIGGRFRRRKLKILDSPGLRPTPDRVRETLFNWLAFELAGRHVLDLFAGTGALGLEALSRGAGSATFVEAAPLVARALEANLTMLGVAQQAAANGGARADRVGGRTDNPEGRTNDVEAPGQAQVICRDVRDYLATSAETPPAPFDLVFLDPPFRQALVEDICTRLVDGGWLAERAWIYVEAEHEWAWTPPADWELHREVRAGDSHGRLFRRTPSPA